MKPDVRLRAHDFGYHDESNDDLEDDSEVHEVGGGGGGGVPPGFEHDEEEELGGAGNGNEEEVPNIRWEGGQCGDDDTNKGASDDYTNSDGDSDGGCSGLRDTSSSDSDDIEDVVNQGHEGPLTVKKAVDDLGKCVMIVEHDEESDCSDDNCSVVSSSDEEEVKKNEKKNVKYPEFNEDKDMKSPKLVEGMLFPNVKVFRTFLKKFHVRNGYMTEMFILHDSLGRDIECFVSHPDVENDDEEELGWEGVPPGFEHDEEEELGGAGNGNEEEVQNIRWEGGQCGDDDTNKGASDDDTDSNGDSDGACSGLRDSSSSDGDDIEDVVNQGHEEPLTVKKAVDGLGKCVMIVEHDEESDCSDDNCSVVSSSDEEEGLTESMDLLFPGVEHRFCMRHYYSNFQKVHKGKELKDLLWGAASAYTLPKYHAKMRELRAVSMEAHNWLIHEPHKNLARCFYSPVAKTNRMVNNLSESFNNAIKKVRDQPILTMMKSLRKHVMQRHACAAMIKARRKPEDFIFPYFLIETFRKSYAYLINPIPDKSMWMRTEFEDIMPSPYRRKSGRPKKTKRKGAKEALAERGTIFKCRKCNQPSHNAKTCKAQVSSTSAEVEESSTSQGQEWVEETARGGVSRGKEVVVAARGVSRGKPVVVAARGGLSREKGVAVQTGGDRAVQIDGRRNDQTGASGVARALFKLVPNLVCQHWSGMEKK
ncbi:hypothetical protein RHMOL_Rhmol11G0090800 [Rhododendron molle]|uniref:Uncharacterized protein n=1 Tax=Rhododendron molle TaxID=49168 RepID=A0ACC0LRU0_RHOML|nr:hypothetical protein RHMOL_Rhmol11G0090800 [Rhododendron molle]